MFDRQFKNLIDNFLRESGHVELCFYQALRILKLPQDLAVRVLLSNHNHQHSVSLILPDNTQTQILSSWKMGEIVGAGRDNANASKRLARILSEQIQSKYPKLQVDPSLPQKKKNHNLVAHELSCGIVSLNDSKTLLISADALGSGPQLRTLVVAFLANEKTSMEALLSLKRKLKTVLKSSDQEVDWAFPLQAMIHFHRNWNSDLAPEDDKGLKAPIPPEVIEIFKHQTEAFKQKFGREPAPEDPIFFDPKSDVPKALVEAETIEGAEDVLRSIGANPENIYAFKKTGIILTDKNRKYQSESDLAEWNAAIDEYRKLQGTN